MGTQGLVSVVNDGKVVLKVVAGCNGYKAKALAHLLEIEGVRLLEEPLTAALLAKQVEFGCEDCLVTQTPAGDFIGGNNEATNGLEGISQLYREKFTDPQFNPRWEHGATEHVEIVDLAKPRRRAKSKKRARRRT